MQKQQLNKLLYILLLPAGFLLTLAAKSHPALVEKWYAGVFYPALAQLVSRLTGLLPFSLAELLIVAAVLGVLALLAVAIHKLRTKTLTKAWALARLLDITAIACAVYFLFVITSGINYHRYTFAYHSGLTVRPSSTKELSALCEELIQEANRLGDLQQRTDTASQSHYEMSRRAGEGMQALALRYPVLGGRYSNPKPVLLSEAMSMAQITGVFFPFTFEANVNTAVPDYTIPAVMAHEQAHQRGFMREDEANFIAYLTCRESDYAEFQYSGVMLALVHSMNSLYKNDYSEFERLYADYSGQVLSDMRENTAYWQKYEGRVVAKVSDKVNDTYLRVNSQTDGVLSYGRVVDLLLADYRARHGLQ